MNDDEILRRAMSIIGRRKTERKSAASRANAAKATAAATAAKGPGKPCNCGRTDGTHRWTCPIYRKEAQRKHRAAHKTAPPPT